MFKLVCEVLFDYWVVNWLKWVWPGALYCTVLYCTVYQQSVKKTKKKTGLLFSFSRGNERGATRPLLWGWFDLCSKNSEVNYYNPGVPLSIQRLWKAKESLTCACAWHSSQLLHVVHSHVSAISKCPLKPAVIKFLIVVFICGIMYYAIHVCLCLCAGQRMQLEQWRRGWMATGITGKWCWL